MNDKTFLLLRRIIKSARVTEGRLDGLLGDVELSTTKLLTLRHLDNTEEAVSLGALAHCMAFAKSNATQLIDHLESSGLVRRVRSSDDRRCTQVALTGHGRQQRESGSRAIRPLVERIESVFTAEERDLLSDFLRRLEEALS